MSFVTKQPSQTQLQQGLNRDQERQQVEQPQEPHHEQLPELHKPFFGRPKKIFMVDLAGGWERP